MIFQETPFFYENSDDVINASKPVTEEDSSITIAEVEKLFNIPPMSIASRKRVFESVSSEFPEYNHNNSSSGSLPDFESDNSTSDESEMKSDREPKRMKQIRHHRVPECITKQSTSLKSNLKEVIDLMQQLTYVHENSSVESQVSYNNDVNDTGIPIMLFFFTPMNQSTLKFFEMFTTQNVKVIAVTPGYNHFNNHNFPIVLDKRGQLSKLLRIRDPVGGGVYPIPTVIIYDRLQNEVTRIQLGYDYNVYYDSSVENNLQNVLIECINYTLNI